jgi:hypothetical protein
VEIERYPQRRFFAKLFSEISVYIDVLLVSKKAANIFERPELERLGT